MTVQMMIFKKHHENNAVICLQQWMGSILNIQMKMMLMMHTGSPGKSTRIYLIFDCMQLYYKDANADNVNHYELGEGCVSNEEE